jgi:hypothetical protein
MQWNVLREEPRSKERGGLFEMANGVMDCAPTLRGARFAVRTRRLTKASHHKAVSSLRNAEVQCTESPLEDRQPKVREARENALVPFCVTAILHTKHVFKYNEFDSETRLQFPNDINV